MTVGKKVLAAGGLALVALALSLGAAEAALRFVLPSPKVYRMLLPGQRIFEPDGRYVHGITGPANYVVNEHGIRGREFGPDSAEYRILLVGGSTTECALLDETENWGYIAERAIGRTADGRSVWVGNVGRSGLTSRDNAVTIKYLLPQYPRIDLIVVLVGVNDLTAALRQGESYRSPAPLSDSKAEAIQVRNSFALSPGGFRETLTDNSGADVSPWYRSTRLFQIAKQARVGLQARNVVRGVSGASLKQWREHRQSASRLLTELPDLKKPLADYRSHLEAVVSTARAAGAEVVFVTQPTLWKKSVTPAEEKLLWLGGTGAFQEEPGHAYYAVPTLADAMARYNQEALAVCREHGLACLDAATLLPSDTVTFYDDVHFTEAGAAKLGQLVAAHLRAAKPDLFRPASSR